MDDLTDLLEHLIDESRLPAQPPMEYLRERAGRRFSRRVRGRSMVVVPLVGIATAALVVVMVLQLLPATGQVPTSAAAAVLNHAASVAANQPASQTPGPGQYLHDRTTEGRVGDSGAPVGQRQFLLFSIWTTDTWVAPDGSGRERVDVNVHLLFRSEQQAWEAAGSPNLGGLRTGIYSGTFPTRTLPVGVTAIDGPNGEYLLPYPSSTNVPTSPMALKRYLNRYDNNGVSSDPTSALLIASTIFEKGASPALRSALFKVIEQLPGVTVVGPTKDEAGRSGLGIAINSRSSLYTGGNTRYVLIFDPNTSAVLGIEEFAGPSYRDAGVPVPKGTLIGFTNYGPTSVVSSVSASPK